NTFRYRIYESGNTGRLYMINDSTFISGEGFASKAPEHLRVVIPLTKEKNTTILNWILKGKQAQFATKINHEEWISFQNGNVKLHSRINLPDGSGPFPAIVLVHGSGRDAATDFYYNGDFFAAHGIAALTYDKRGTGNSTGDYTFDYDLLASDAIAAVRYLQSRNDILAGQIGLSGYSQGCWVAPLAAAKSSDISFVINNYGLIESGTMEAIIETRNTLIKRGLKIEDSHEVDALTEATVNVVASGFKDGWTAVDSLDKKYKNAYWRKLMKGTTVHEFLKYPKWLVKIIGPKRAPKDLDWTYSSDEVLKRLDIPVVWLLAEKDNEAPNELTIPKIKSLIDKGKPFELKIFKDADHTILLFNETNGQRKYTKYDEEYFFEEVNSVLKICNEKRNNSRQLINY
ncbi:MAG: alpha/beta fold hydrolase, partial [Bacteroidia bacterium]|nr:alpha/beta fold hydrolase [Bacteroidia bacterium]